MTAAELVERGLTRAEIRAMVRRGVLTSVRHGVYVRPDLAAGVDERVLAIAVAVALIGNGAASHQDAAVLHGLALLKRPPRDRISVSRSRRFAAANCRSGAPTILVHDVRLPRGALTMRYRTPVTSVARTVVDIARVTPFRDGLVTADSALRQKKTSKDELRQVVSAMPRWPGITRARDVIAFADHRAESPLESISRVAFRDGGLPPPKLQQWVDDGHGCMIGRVDFLWPEHSTIAEADGAAKYANPDKARLQLERDTDLRDAGYEVVHYTWWELDRVAEVVIGRIRTCFLRAARSR